MCALYLGLSFLAGITIGTVVVGLINVVIFLAAALVLTRLAPDRWEPYATPFSLTGALGVATLWPVFWLPDGPSEPKAVTVTIERVEPQ